MALQVCKECKAQVSSKAKTCPSCGAPINRGIDPGKGLVIVGVGCLIFYFASTINLNGKTSGTQGKSTYSEPSVQRTPEWNKFDFKDEMSGKSGYVYILKSKNSYDFDFPYKIVGGTYLSANYRKNPRGGFDAYFDVEKGHLPCHGCYISVSVDGGPIKKYKASSAGNGVSTTIFFDDANQFKNIVKLGKPFKVELQFYEYGNRTYEFPGVALDL